MVFCQPHRKSGRYYGSLGLGAGKRHCVLRPAGLIREALFFSSTEQGPNFAPVFMGKMEGQAMSKIIFWIGLLMLSTTGIAQNADQGQMQEGTWARPAIDEAAPSDATEGRVFDEGQVQMPREGQVENMPEGQVEAINPTDIQAPSRDTQPDLFRFESRLFNPIPSDE
jgi:hypothetical protein